MCHTQILKKGCCGNHTKSNKNIVTQHHFTFIHNLFNYYNKAMLVNIQRPRPHMRTKLLLWKHYFSVIKRPQQQHFVHSRHRKIFYRSLSIQQHRRRYNRIPRESLVDPTDSAWRKLYQSHNDQALITATVLDYSTFEYLLLKFKPLYDYLTPHSKDGDIKLLKRKERNPRIIEASDCLGLVLMWTRTRGSMFSLQMKFGISGTATGLYIRFARRLLLHIFQNDDNARIRILSDHNIEQYKKAIKARHSVLNGVWCAMDGLKLLLESSGISKEQNMFYNGWTHDTYVTSVICFCADGTIPITCFNVPGCQHDSTIAEWGNVYKKLEKNFNRTNGKCVVDSVFSKKRNLDYLNTFSICPIKIFLKFLIHISPFCNCTIMLTTRNIEASYGNSPISAETNDTGYISIVCPTIIKHILLF